MAPLARPAAAAAEPSFTIGENFGIQNGEIWSHGTGLANTELDGMASTGAKWVRLGLSWNNIEPNAPVGGVHTYNFASAPGEPDREYFDRAIQGALDRGMKVLLTFNFTAAWAADPQCVAAGTDPTRCPPAPDATTQANWSAFVTAAVNRYKDVTLTGGGTGHVTAFEFYNEPNNVPWRSTTGGGVGAGLNGAIYAQQVLPAAAAAVRSVTPPSGTNWTIVTAGLDSHLSANSPTYETPPYFMAQVWFVDPTGSNFDVIGVHPYVYDQWANPNAGQGMQYADQIFNDANSHGQPRKLWATEFGLCTSGTDACGVVQDAINNLPGYMEAWMSKFYSGPAFLYALQDTTGHTLSEDSFGLVHNDFSDKVGAGGVTLKNVYVLMNAFVLPTVSIGNFSVGESNSGNPVASFNAVLSNPMTTGTTAYVTFGTSDGTAVAGSDYTPPSGLGAFLVFGPGQTTATGHVTILSDTLDEANQTFHVNLAWNNAAVQVSAAGDTSTATIVDDDPTAPAVKIGNTANFEGDTGSRSLVYNINLPDPVCSSCAPVTYHVLTSGGTATPGTDYTAVDTTVTFNPGDVIKTVSVPVNGDTTVESNETVIVRVRNVGSTTNLGSGTGTITNDD